MSAASERGGLKLRDTMSSSGRRIPVSPLREKAVFEACRRTYFLVNPGKSVYRIWRDDRAVEGVRLESVCTLTGYRGFESLSLRIPLGC
jgi:hypothetical protein